MQRFDLVIFDFDGTLADTGPVICDSFAAAVQGTAAARDAAAFRSWLGQPLELVHALLQAEEAAFDLSVAVFVARYKKAYQSADGDRTRLFPAVRELLGGLRAPLAIASTRPTSALIHQARHLGIDHHFSHIQGTDGFAHKPDPEILHRVWRVLCARPERTLFIGDSTMDIQAGRAAGVTTVGVTHGAHPREALQAAGAHHVIDTFEALASLPFGP